MNNRSMNNRSMNNRPVNYPVNYWPVNNRPVNNRPVTNSGAGMDDGPSSWVALAGLLSPGHGGRGESEHRGDSKRATHEDSFALVSCGAVPRLADYQIADAM
jgi:hypothetical protein